MVAAVTTATPDIRLGNGERGILIGGTRTGKSTLATQLVRYFLDDHPEGRVLILDSKPRYRAQYVTNGLASWYRGWVKGEYLEDSVSVTAKSERLPYLFSQHRIVLYQSLTPIFSHMVDNYFKQCAEYCVELFRYCRVDRPCLLYIDELYDEMKANWIDNRILRTYRAGGERNLAVLCGAQRPKAIPLPSLTEATQYYIFKLKYRDDVIHLRHFGPTMPRMPQGHEFYFYRHMGGFAPESAYCVLDIGQGQVESV